ncbi:charged multivesicular body protein 7-like, partial [Geospiza fortis]|uniref:Charged multivesicular body protein 7-like n=1 Tax=Geospiza fortis TaxID=48883 RepID=A0A8N5F5T7_GEOFO
FCLAGSLQEKAEEVYRLYQSSALSSHPVVALSELRSLCAGLCPDERTFYLLLLQLQKEKRVTILEQNGEKVQGPGDCFWVVSSLSCLPSAWREMDFRHSGPQDELCDTQDEVAQTLAGVGINGLEMDSEELEKELDSLLQDSSKDSLDLPAVPHKVLSAPISDAELEAELEQLSVSAGAVAQKTPSASSEPKTALGLNL